MPISSLFIHISISCIVLSETGCIKEVCLTWRTSKQILILTCYIKHVFNRVYFEDPNGRFIGDCSPLIQSKCNLYRNEGKLYRKQFTNKFIFEVNAVTETRLFGAWKCRHGTNGETAVADIHSLNDQESGKSFTMQTSEVASPILTKDRITTYLPYNQSEETISTLLKTTITEPIEPLSTVAVPINIDYNDIDDKNTKLDRMLKIYLVPMGAGIAVLIVLSVICNFFVIRKWLTLPNLRIQKRKDNGISDVEISNRREAQSGSNEDLEFEYASINENEIQTDNTIVRVDEKNSSSLKSSTSSIVSINSYLDVLDGSDTSTSYESTCIVPKINDVHMYCMTHQSGSDTAFVNEISE